MALFVFDFSSDDCNTPEQLETMVMQCYLFIFFFGGGGGGVRGGVEGINKVHYGLCENGEY